MVIKISWYSCMSPEINVTKLHFKIGLVIILHSAKIILSNLWFSSSSCWEIYFQVISTTARHSRVPPYLKLHTRHPLAPNHHPSSPSQVHLHSFFLRNSDLPEHSIRKIILFNFAWFCMISRASCRKHINVNSNPRSMYSRIKTEIERGNIGYSWVGVSKRNSASEIEICM